MARCVGVQPKAANMAPAPSPWMTARRLRNLSSLILNFRLFWLTAMQREAPLDNACPGSKQSFGLSRVSNVARVPRCVDGKFATWLARASGTLRADSADFAVRASKLPKASLTARVPLQPLDICYLAHSRKPHSNDLQVFNLSIQPATVRAGWF